ncbi:50S ribosomal protein L24 [Cyclobacteriaceae bacterium]|nr:50S ribosomal protein L24 [Cyclobacteriaceae bacterium]
MTDIKKIQIKKGDTVKILTGNDNGKTGKVLEIITSKYRAIVEGVNMVTKGLKSSAAMFLGNPHSCIFNSGPTTITDRPE